MNDIEYTVRLALSMYALAVVQVCVVAIRAMDYPVNVPLWLAGGIIGLVALGLLIKRMLFDGD